MLQKGAAFLEHPHLALPLAAGLRHSGSVQRVFCGFRTANSVRLKKTVPNQRFGTVFLLFLGFFGGAEGLQALLDEVGDGAAADAAVKVVALEVEIRGVVVLIADGLKDFLEGARLHDLAEGVDVLDALARDVLDAQTAAVVRHQSSPLSFWTAKRTGIRLTPYSTASLPSVSRAPGLYSASRILRFSSR